ncbi:MAG: RHS repeat-associated core domain-containing protein [Acidobacteriota bacterium]|nr:RHS repeat-associated core domain-containing protein [Acidobacteriota bacterium]
MFDRQYAYNSANRISQITEPTGSRAFGYDGFDRLSSVTNGATNESYDYDSVGNRSSSHLSSTYSYQQPFNRLTAAGAASYDYDSNGNMTVKREGSKRWTYYWDYENRLSFASDRKTAARYTYDALGRRVARHAKARGGSTKFIYDGQDVLADDNDGVLSKYLNGRGVDKKLRAQTGTGISYFLVDQLGSTTGLADTSGNLTASTAYDSFGNATNQNFPTRYQFTGRELDSFTGLHYYRARQYDSQLGRFISEDPIGFAGGDINLYGYVWNSPQDFTDPTGHGGWGSDAADWLDERIEHARQYYTPNELEWEANGVNNSVADVAMGFTNLLRVGNGIGYALYNCDENIYGRMAYVAMDVERASAILSMLGAVPLQAGSASLSRNKSPKKVIIKKQLHLTLSSRKML